MCPEILFTYILCYLCFFSPVSKRALRTGPTKVPSQLLQKPELPVSWLYDRKIPNLTVSHSPGSVHVLVDYSTTEGATATRPITQNESMIKPRQVDGATFLAFFWHYLTSLAISRINSSVICLLNISWGRLLTGILLILFDYLSHMILMPNKNAYTA